MSFFADLLASAADQGKQMIDRDQEQALKLEAEQRASDLAVARQKEMDQNRLDMAEKQRLAKQASLSQDMRTIDAATPAATQARQVGEANRVAPSVDSNVLDIIKSKLTPEELKKYYGINDRADYSVMDKLNVARSKGLGDAEAQLEQAYKDTVTQLRDEQKQKNFETGEARKEKRDDQRHGEVLATIQGRKDVAEMRGNGKGDGTASERLDLARIREKRVDLQKQADTVLKKIELGLMKPEEGKAKLAKLEAQQNTYQQQEDAASAAPTGAPAPAAKPTPTKTAPTKSNW